MTKRYSIAIDDNTWAEITSVASREDRRPHVQAARILRQWAAVEDALDDDRA